MRIRAYRTVRLGVATLLVLTGALKLHAGAGALADRSLASGAAIAAILGGVECALGALLASRVWSAAVWFATLTLFACFWAVASAKVLAGSPVCGCFGALKAPPVAALLIDSGVLLAMLKCAPLDPRNLRIGSVLKKYRSSVLMVEVVVSVASLAIAATSITRTSNTAPGWGRPERWVGHRLPILSTIDVAARLQHGKCLVVLYHHDCPSCVHLLRTYVDLIRGGAGELPQVALIELPPFSAHDDHCAEMPGCMSGRADGEGLRGIEAPLELLVIDGVVWASTRR